MELVEICESQMTFVIPKERLFHLEKSALMAAMPQRTKSPEFITFNPQRNSIALFEAKQTAPQPGDSLDNWIDPISEKFSTALHLFHAMRLGRHPAEYNSDLGADFQHLKLNGLNYTLIIVVKYHDTHSIPPLMDAVKKRMNPLIKWWNIPDRNIQVINEKIARDWKLIK